MQTSKTVVRTHFFSGEKIKITLWEGYDEADDDVMAKYDMLMLKMIMMSH